MWIVIPNSRMVNGIFRFLDRCKFKSPWIMARLTTYERRFQTFNSQPRQNKSQDNSFFIISSICISSFLWNVINIYSLVCESKSNLKSEPKWHRKFTLKIIFTLYNSVVLNFEWAKCLNILYCHLIHWMTGGKISQQFG